MLGDRYRIEALIGAGGYGRVYRAKQLPIDREVAIKVVDPLDREAVARFRRELGFVKQLEHPNTVRVLDFGTSSDGLPFIVMEYLRGRSVFDMLTEHTRLAPRIALEIVAQVLKALAEAHAIGIVHRDIKPENVFVTSHAGQPVFVKVLDFGIAKRRRGTESVVTVHGDAPGTPHYMAPEQVYGMEPDARTDLYAVGLMLAEMLTGRTVFDGGPQSILRAQASQAPAPLDPSLHGMPGADVVRKATQKQPRDRYASATEMLAAVEEARAGRPATSPQPPRGRDDDPTVPREVPRRDRTARVMAMPVRAQPPMIAATGQSAPAPRLDETVKLPLAGRGQVLPFLPARPEARSQWAMVLAIAGIVVGLGLIALVAAFLLRPAGTTRARDAEDPRRVKEEHVAPGPSASATGAPVPAAGNDRIKLARTTELAGVRRLVVEHGYEIDPTQSDETSLRAIKGTCIGELGFLPVRGHEDAIRTATAFFVRVGDAHAVYDDKRVVVIFMRHTMGNKPTDRCTRPVFDILAAP